MGAKDKSTPCEQTYISTDKAERQIASLFEDTVLSSSYCIGLRHGLEKILRAQNQQDNGWIKILENKKAGILRKMDKLEDLLLEEVIDRKRLIEKYSRLKEELDTVEGQIEQAKISSRKLKKEDIERIVKFLSTFDQSYDSYGATKKRLFLRIVISKLFLKNEEIARVEYTPRFRAIVDKDLVRISNNWCWVRDLIRTLNEISSGENDV